ncbi:MAG: hypothetical protein IKA03_00195, partial [Alphaproteobacteria bacterium]|nr:hypothetical protein [Alphaproteobacteria bacterium]
KVLSLPLGFFSKERKGDIIARMSGDVVEVENSIAGSIDMLIKNPIYIIIYFATLIYISWELTLFTLTVIPVMGWIMGLVGRKLKQKSLVAQSKLGETMSQMEETLGGLRIVKAFLAEKKMSKRFLKVSNELRNATMRVTMRQAMAHPVSEFLGTCVIVIVLWFGGTLILGNNSPISAPAFIYYLTILYSVINPLKEFSKASYNIPRGLASMERIDKILDSENPIVEEENAVSIKGMEKAKREVAIDGNLILCCMRDKENLKENFETLEVAKKYLGQGVCAVDLAGAEALFATREFEELFSKARVLEIPFTIHAGEAAGAESIKKALDFGAMRIGHGVRCLEDSLVVEEIVRKGVVLEVCPISNLQTKATGEPHPIDKIYEAGVKTTINTDNNTVSNTSLVDEYRYVLENTGLTIEDIKKMNIIAAEAAFVYADKKVELVKKIKEQL